MCLANSVTIRATTIIKEPRVMIIHHIGAHLRSVLILSVDLLKISAQCGELGRIASENVQFGLYKKKSLSIGDMLVLIKRQGYRCEHRALNTDAHCGGLGHITSQKVQFGSYINKSLPIGDTLVLINRYGYRCKPLAFK